MKKVLRLLPLMALVLATPAWAQDLQELRDINVLNFYTTGILGRHLVTEDATVQAPGSWDLGLVLWYANGLLKVRESGSGLQYNALDHQTAALLVVRRSFSGPFADRRWELGAAMPFSVWQADSGDVMGVEAPESWAWGDPLLYAKAVLLRDGIFSLGIKPYLFFGVGRADSNATSGWSGGASLLLGLGASERLSFGAEAGFVYRSPVEVVDVAVGKAVKWSAGLTYSIHPSLHILLDVWGETNLEGEVTAKEVPVEMDFAMRFVRPFGSKVFRILAGLGTGAGTNAPGNPDARAFLALQIGGRTPLAPVVNDRDGDGILDKDDRCPDEPEDRDGFEDADGCPDPDNDGDRIPDVRDKCPNEPEDYDKYHDRDGCPDPDNDRDGILDKDDRCPDDAEDKDGFEDEDGCPDLDNDHDGVMDVDDKCPNVAEDRDGFEDEDGCPDYDNDKDGIPDAKDKCPNEPETINGNKDDDGCPDKGKSLVRLTEKKIEILQKIYFYYNKAKIKPKSYPVLAQVATILKLHKEIKLVEIQGHTDTIGSDEYNMKLSQKRAEAVRRFLIDAGVEPERLVAKGYGETRPLVTTCSKIRSRRRRRRCEEKNRRVEFVIVKQEHTLVPVEQGGDSKKNQ